jgi:hypothetical protein
MQKFIKHICFILLLSTPLASVFGQACTPNPVYDDSIQGIWPDTIQNVPFATVNSFYQTTINFKFPTAVTPELDPSGSYVGSPIQSYSLTSINGLPAGFSYTCGNGNCSYLGGELGCVLIEGNYNGGIYPFSLTFDIEVLIYIIPGFPPTPVTTTITITGYELTNCPNAINETISNNSNCSYTSQSGITYNQSGTYFETIPNVYGCDSVNLTLNLNILSSSSSSSFSTDICEGDTYNWNGQQYNSAGQYEQTFVAANGCDSIVTLNLSVLANNFNPTFSSTQQLFTSPPFVVQFSNSTANASNYSFVWYWGDGTSSSSNNASVFHEYLNNGQYTVSLVATNNTTGCSDTTTITDYIYCTGGASCTHTAAINQQGPIEECTGTDVWLTSNNDPSFTYQWRRNGINVPGNNNDSLLVTQTGNYTVTIFVNNCPVTSNGIAVTINPLPSIPTITSTGTITSCSGGSLTLSAPAGSSSYSWNTGATTASITVTQSGNYTVTVTNSNGCAITSAPYVVNASFMSSPNVCVVGMDSLTNENRIVWEKPLTLGIDSFYVYKETNVSDVYTKIGATDYPDLAVFLDQNSNPAVQAFRYKLTVLDTCGTETLLSDFHKTIHLTINAGVGGAWNLIWSHYEGLTFGSYNIYRGTDLTNISLLTTIQSNLNSYTDLAPPVGPVYYQIEIVNPNSCDPTKIVNYSVSKSNIVNNGVNGINALANSIVLVYPNPTSKDVTLEITDELIGKDYFLTDNTGRIILSGQFRALKETVNLEQIATGVYFIKIDNNANLIYKIVKN